MTWPVNHWLSSAAERLFSFLMALVWIRLPWVKICHLEFLDGLVTNNWLVVSKICFIFIPKLRECDPVWPGIPNPSKNLVAHRNWKLEHLGIRWNGYFGWLRLGAWISKRNLGKEMIAKGGFTLNSKGWRNYIQKFNGWLARMYFELHGGVVMDKTFGYKTS